MTNPFQPKGGGSDGGINTRQPSQHRQGMRIIGRSQFVRDAMGDDGGGMGTRMSAAESRRRMLASIPPGSTLYVPEQKRKPRDDDED